MASTFTTAENVSIPGNFGKKINVPFYLQFVPGTVVEVITSDESFMSLNKPHLVNTILAMPHITNKPKRRKANVDNADRYYPLMRGFVDVPAKGDPVLLCTVGGIKYYLGPLNTENNPNFNEDFLLRPETQVTGDDNYEPSANEKTIAKGQSINFRKIKHKRMIKKGNINLDKYVEGQSAINETHGDMMLEGRHGNSLRVGSRDKNPYIYISNGRNSNNFYESLTDGSLISITNNGTLADHFGGYYEVESKPDPADSETWTINQIPSFQLTSDAVENNQRQIASIVKSVNQVDDVNTVLYNYGDTSQQNQVLIHSDRIIFNAKGSDGDIYLSSKRDVHIGSGRHLTLSTNKNLIIESNKIFLGDPNKEANKDKMEPVVLGNALFDIFDELFAILEATTSVYPSPLSLAHNGAPLTTVLTPLRQKLETIKSQYHFVEPNGRQTQ